MKKTATICGVLFLAAVMTIACGKQVPDKPKLDLDAECTSAYTAGAKQGGDQATFVALCKKHLERPKSYLICVTPDAPQSYCDKGMADEAIKAEIDAMKGALGG